MQQRIVQYLLSIIKNSLTKLRLVPEPDGSGAIVPGRSKGFMEYPNDNKRHPIALVPGTPRCIHFEAGGLDFESEAEPLTFETEEESLIYDVLTGAEAGASWGELFRTYQVNEFYGQGDCLGRKWAESVAAFTKKVTKVCENYGLDAGKFGHKQHVNTAKRP